ncbi:MAG: nucleotidyltransferase family protein [Roseiflexus sp.]|nr:nucleotidyltransferase family protein [Roseiflexus sp.]
MRLPEKDMNEWRIIVPTNEIASFCQRWKIRQLALFGSVLRDDFSEESDLDILVDFEEGTDWGLLDHVQMQQELQALFRRNVDLISKRALLQSANWLRRREILNTAQLLFPNAGEVHATG